MNGWQCVARPLGIVLVLIPLLVVVYVKLELERVVIEFCCLKEELHSEIIPIGRALNIDDEV